MANIKRVTIDDSCTLCGLCQQPELSSIIKQEGTKLRVVNKGLINVEKYPLLLESMELCPVHALHIESDETTKGSKAEMLEKLNNHIYNKCRAYDFDPPDPFDYYYDTGLYVADPIPTIQSEYKYRTDQAAENAGFTVFERSIYSQAEVLIRQSLAKYKVRMLKPYFSYEKDSGDYYHQKNAELQTLLEEAQQLALAVSDGKIKLPKDFTEFEVVPEWLCPDRKYLLELYTSATDIPLDLDSRNKADYYRSWINTDGYDKCCYDLAEAEQEFREDMDNLAGEIINPLAESWVTDVTTAYLKRAKSEFFKKLDLLQKAIKNSIQIDDSSVFTERIQTVYKTITAAQSPDIKVPHFDMDTAFNSNYRFYSERECEKAAENRRERAHREASNFVRHSDRELSENCAAALSQALTQWVRMLLTAYDVAGKPYPKNALNLKIGEHTISIILDSSHEIKIPADKRIETYVTKSILDYGTSVGDVKLKSEYSYDIRIDHDCDLVETWFGNFKETNHRYAYWITMGEIRYDAQEVVNACTKALRKSSFWKSYFDQVKKSFLQELAKVTGIRS